MLEVIDTSIVNVALAEIQTSVGATLAQTSWVVSSYAVANVIVLPLAIGLLAVGLGALQTVLEEGNSEDWFESRLIIALAIASVMGLVAFVLRELEAENPVVDLRMLRHRSLWARCC